MALMKSVNFKGILVEDAYIRVIRPTLQNGNDRIEFGVHYMATPNKPPFSSVTVLCPYDLEGANPVTQAYEYIKTLEEFVDAKDC